jgi:hypothetical protein
MIGVLEGGTTLKQQSVGWYVAPHFSDSDSTREHTISQPGCQTLFPHSFYNYIAVIRYIITPRRNPINVRINVKRAQYFHTWLIFHSFPKKGEFYSWFISPNQRTPVLDWLYQQRRKQCPSVMPRSSFWG